MGNLQPERRQDVGLKMVYSMLSAIIAILLTLFFNKTYNLAEEAYRQVNESKVRIAVIESQYCELIRRLESIDSKLDKAIDSGILGKGACDVKSYRLGS